MEDLKKMHWSEIIAKRIAEKKDVPFVVAAGITPSGPVHPGTLCEFLYADAIAKQLSKYGNVHYVFISDDLDDLDSVPEPLKEHKGAIEKEIGTPLAYAKDPEGCHESFAEHFITETQKIMEMFEVFPEFVRASKLYRQGKYDDYAKQMCEKKDAVKEIVRKSSLKESMPSDWFPIIPICEKCINSSKNVVMEYAGGMYKYKCNRCGHEGEDRIENHRYKLRFRLDWPTRQKFLHVVAEGGSVDHHTKGGTISTLIAVHKEFYDEEPPYMYKFGFLKYKGKKYSKSKGIGHTVNEMIDLLPIPVIKYALLKPDVQEDKEFVISKETLFKMLDDFKRASEIKKDDEKVSRADRKRAISYELCNVKRVWAADPSDMVLYYNIYGNWEKVKEKTGDESGVEMLKEYIQKWIERDLVPDRYMFNILLGKCEDKVVKSFVEKLDENMGAEEVHNLVFETAKQNNIEPKEMFARLYMWLIGKEMGPRLGKLIYAIGIEKVKSSILD